MGALIDSLCRLQEIERRLATVRSGRKSRENAAVNQQRLIERLRGDCEAFEAKAMARRVKADGMELDLKSREQQVSKLRQALNAAKTNKEYAALLTQINSFRADNSKLEEEVLKVLQEIDTINADAAEARQQGEAEEKRLEGIRQTNRQELERLNGMFEDLKAQRAEAAKAMPPEVLAAFTRIAENYDGDAMAAIEIYGSKPPHDYVCGGCFMSLTAEHVNALRVRDEIRTCDNCGRILYLKTQGQGSPAQ